MKGKVIIITGGTSGIGQALAYKFGKEGSKVVITGRNQRRLYEVKEEMLAQQIEVAAFQGDVSNEDDCKRIVSQTIEEFGKINVLINNAGISMRATFLEVDLQVIKDVMNINFWGAVYCTKYCLDEIIKNKGSIVGISSIAGYRGLPGRIGYSSSKFALQGFLEALRTELLRTGVHVLTACPGFTSSNIRKRSLMANGTQQAESPRKEEKMMSAETCATIIYKAVKRRKKHVIMTFQGKVTVFLNKWFSGWMDKMVYKAMAKEPNSPFK